MAANILVGPSITGRGLFEGVLVFFSIDALTDMVTTEDGETVVGGGGWRKRM
jgi:hypothetical protein